MFYNLLTRGHIQPRLNNLKTTIDPHLSMTAYRLHEVHEYFHSIEFEKKTTIISTEQVQSFFSFGATPVD